jgi:hypothetical protein
MLDALLSWVLRVDRWTVCTLLNLTMSYTFQSTPSIPLAHDCHFQKAGAQPQSSGDAQAALLCTMRVWTPHDDTSYSLAGGAVGPVWRASHHATAILEDVQRVTYRCHRVIGSEILAVAEALRSMLLCTGLFWCRVQDSSAATCMIGNNR